jgi:tubulin-folding cofactor B
MNLQILSRNTREVLHELNDDNRRLDTYQHIQDYAILNVIPVGNAAKQKRDIYNDTSLVEKFEISKEEYEKRSDTVKAFKERMKLGRFDPEAVAEKNKKEEEFIQKTIQDAHIIKVGQRCQVLCDDNFKRGEIKFVGN